MNRNASYVSVAAVLANLSAEELLAISEKPNLLKEFAKGLVVESAQNTFVTHLDDKDVPEQYREVTAKWRKYAAACGYTGPVAWNVRSGFTLKRHAPLAGPCYSRLEYLKDWELRNDEPTRDSLVFWVPRLVEGSTGKSISQMEKFRVELQKRYDLPGSHAISFGSIALLFALILAHFKRTGERVPLEYLYTASDSFLAGGGRLIAGDFGEDGLDCGGWVERADGDVGFFLLGVELGQ